MQDNSLTDGCGGEEIPDTYLDWVIGQDWFVAQARNAGLLKEIERELATRKRSYASVRDEWDREIGGDRE